MGNVKLKCLLPRKTVCLCPMRLMRTKLMTSISYCDVRLDEMKGCVQVAQDSVMTGDRIKTNWDRRTICGKWWDLQDKELLKRNSWHLAACSFLSYNPVSSRNGLSLWGRYQPTCGAYKKREQKQDFYSSVHQHTAAPTFLCVGEEQAETTVILICCFHGRKEEAHCVTDCFRFVRKTLSFQFHLLVTCV